MKRLREDNDECNSCGESAAVVAWCKNCEALICQSCVTLHKKIVKWRKHHVVEKQDNVELEPVSSSRQESKCLRHVDENLKYLCVPCSELVCSACLLLGSHKDHQFSSVEEARPSLETKMEEMTTLVEEKKKEFSEYLEEGEKVEGRVLEYSEAMKTKVNNVFDSIVASVEAQRNEALQCVSRGAKDIWAQKELMGVSLAQLDSFTRFADRTRNCTMDVSYVAMATQGIKLMEQLKDIRGDEKTLNQKTLVIITLGSDERYLHVPLHEVFVLGQPALKFSYTPGSVVVEDPIDNEDQTVTMLVSLFVKGQPVCSKSLREKCDLIVSMYQRECKSNPEPSSTCTSEETSHNDENVTELEEVPNEDEEQEDKGLIPLRILMHGEDPVESAADENAAIDCECFPRELDVDELSWIITANVLCSKDYYQTLVVKCRLTGDLASETVEVSYRF